MSEPLVEGNGQIYHAIGQNVVVAKKFIPAPGLGCGKSTHNLLNCFHYFLAAALNKQSVDVAKSMPYAKIPHLLPS